MRRLQQYPWPGNIRQLQNVIEQSAILCDEDELHVPAAVLAAARSAAHAPDTMPAMFAENPTLEELKKRYISHSADDDPRQHAAGGRHSRCRSTLALSHGGAL